MPQSERREPLGEPLNYSPSEAWELPVTSGLYVEFIYIESHGRVY